MNLKQIEYALAVAKYKSFSKAAKELYLSQPNISQNINSLENEIGYKIFNRNNQGIDLTEKGIKFLNHADNIMNEIKSIYDIVDLSVSRNVTVASTFNHTFLTEAFISLCRIYEDSENINFSLLNQSSHEILDNIILNEIDLGVLFMSEENLSRQINNIDNKNLIFKHLSSMHININLRQNHPALIDGKVNFDSLINYPYVNYGFNPITELGIHETFITPPPWLFGDSSKVINVTERETRKKLVIESNAYSMGVSFHPKTEYKDDIISIPIPNITLAFAVIKRKDTKNSEEIEFFINSLIKELHKITI